MVCLKHYNKIRAALLLCLAIVMLGACSHWSDVLHAHDAHKSGRLEIEDLTLSPDGQVVAFQYLDRQNNLTGIGLLNWQSGKLTKIKIPTLREVSFSEDGKRLVGTTRRDVITVDLDTFQITKITNASDKGPESPVFQPGTGHILYVTSYPAHLILVDPVTHTEKVILDKEEGFYTIFRPSFVGQDEVIFTAMTPHDPQLMQAIKDRGLKELTAVQYRLKFGQKPEFTLDELLKHATAIESKNDTGVLNAATSRDGKKTAFIDYSGKDQSLKGAGDYEIFLLDNGKVRQMTNLKSHLRAIAISADGSVVAFGSDPSRTMTHDLFILDTNTGAVQPMFMARRLEMSPDFN